MTCKQFIKKYWKYILGIIVTVGLMTFLIWKSKPTEIWTILKQSNGWLLLVSFGITFMLFVIKTIRWQSILTPQGHTIPFFETLGLVTVGTFGSAVTPAKVGDILRAFYLSKSNPEVKTGLAVFSVVFDRLLDLAGISLVVICSAPFILTGITDLKWWIPLLLAGGILITLLLILFVFTEQITRPILTFVVKIISKMFRKEETREKVNINTMEIIDDFFSCQQKYRIIHYLWLGVLSIGFWVILGLQGSLLLYAFGVPPSSINILIVLSVLCFGAIGAMALPISLGGVGVRDTIIMFLLELLLAISNAHALNLSVIQTFFNVIIPGVIGGLLAIPLSKQFDTEEKEMNEESAEQTIEPSESPPTKA